MLRLLRLKYAEIRIQLTTRKAGSCYANIDSDGNCSQLRANDVTREECCSTRLGVAYDEAALSDVSIFMISAGIKKQKTCKPCQGESTKFDGLFSQFSTPNSKFRIMRKYEMWRRQTMHHEARQAEMRLCAKLQGICHEEIVGELFGDSTTADQKHQTTAEDLRNAKWRADTHRCQHRQYKKCKSASKVPK